MKRRFLTAALFLIFICCLVVPAGAETYHGGEGWHVSFNGSALVSNFSSSDIQDILSEMQPGDNTIVTVDLSNDVPDDVRWYMSNETLRTLEESVINTATGGGAYIYKLTYTNPSGEDNVLFDSDTVGGELISAAGEGLHEATNALEDYFFMDTLGARAQAMVTLEVTLDGETQGNDYQDTLGDIQLNFAVEGTRVSANTGDSSHVLLYVAIMGASGLLLLALAIYSLKKRRAERGR